MAKYEITYEDRPEPDPKYEYLLDDRDEDVILYAEVDEVLDHHREDLERLHPPTRVPGPCGNRVYFQSRESAEKVSERRRKSGTDCDVYDCPYCGGHHIVTKQTPENKE